MSIPAPPPGSDELRWQELHRPFRPRAGRIAPWAAAGVWVTILAVLALGVTDAGPADIVGFAAVAAVSVWVFSRFALVKATATAAGLQVRNLIEVRSVAWQQIVAVSYGRDSTFAQLDLSDGTTMSIFAVQASDGARAQREAARLATLVEVHSGTR